MPEPLGEIEIHVLTHSETGLKMALCNELPGFVVHANSFDELDEKMPAALRSFVKYTRGEDVEWVLVKDEAPRGFDPIAYIAKRSRTAPQAA